MRPLTEVMFVRYKMEDLSHRPAIVTGRNDDGSVNLCIFPDIIMDETGNFMQVSHVDYGTEVGEYLP